MAAERCDHETNTASIEETFQGKHILVTGITGFLGKVWLAMVLDQLPTVGRLYLLARPRRNQTAAERVQEIFERSPVFRGLRARHGQGFEAFLEARIEVLEGDVSEELCGLTEETVERLAGALDVVVHIAGLTDFQPEPLQALSINFLGSRRVADLTARCREPRLVHVSTCFVAGNNDGLVPESIEVGVSPNGTHFDVEHELVAMRSAVDAVNKRFKAYSRDGKVERVRVATLRAQALGWPNIYTYSKGMGEQDLAKREDVRVCTVRPSIVECAQTFPFPGWNEGINTSGPLTWLCGGFVRRLPIASHHIFDVIPVDAVSQGLIVATAASLRDEAEEVYQLASGDVNPILMNRVVELTGLAYRKHYDRDDAKPLERAVLRYLDVITSDTDPKELKMLPAVHSVAHSIRNVVGRFSADKHLPKRLRESAGDRIGQAVMRSYTRLTMTDRMLRRMRDMYDLFRPFIFENQYLFKTQNIIAATAALSPEDQARFGFNLEQLCWRSYWIDVQMPGLRKWSYPLMRGQKAPMDPPRAEQLALLTHEDRRQTRVSRGNGHNGGVEGAVSRPPSLLNAPVLRLDEAAPSGGAAGTAALDAAPATPAAPAAPLRS